MSEEPNANRWSKADTLKSVGILIALVFSVAGLVTWRIDSKSREEWVATQVSIQETQIAFNERSATAQTSIQETQAAISEQSATAQASIQGTQIAFMLRGPKVIEQNEEIVSMLVSKDNSLRFLGSMLDVMLVLDIENVADNSDTLNKIDFEPTTFMLKDIASGGEAIAGVNSTLGVGSTRIEFGENREVLRSNRIPFGPHDPKTLFARVRICMGLSDERIAGVTAIDFFRNRIGQYDLLIVPLQLDFSSAGSIPVSFDVPLENVGAIAETTLFDEYLKVVQRGCGAVPDSATASSN